MARKTNGMRAAHPPDWPAVMSRIRSVLMDMLRRSTKLGQPIAEIVELLDQLDHAHQAARSMGAAAQASSRNKPKRYGIENRRRGAFLVEHREGGKQPFCCPRQLYDVVADAVGRLERTVQSEALLAKVSRIAGRRVPDYLPRVCLRFWLSLDPPLIKKVRTAYGPAIKFSFENAARRAWRELAKQTER